MLVTRFCIVHSYDGNDIADVAVAVCQSAEGALGGRRKSRGARERDAGAKCVGPSLRSLECVVHRVEVDVDRAIDTNTITITKPRTRGCQRELVQVTP